MQSDSGKNPKEPPPATLYYDGQCPLCRTEINQLKKVASKQLQFVDAHNLDNKSKKQRYLQSLHLQQGEQCITGLDANIAMWQYTQHGWLWRGLKLPLIYPVASFIYQWWAKRRYNNRYGDE